MRIINRSIGFHASLTEATTWWNELLMEEVGCTALEVPELETPRARSVLQGDASTALLTRKAPLLRHDPTDHGSDPSSSDGQSFHTKIVCFTRR